MKNIKSFTTMFGLMCVALLWLTILGVDYSINANNQENYLKIRCHKKEKKTNIIKRVFYFSILV